MKKLLIVVLAALVLYFGTQKYEEQRIQRQNASIEEDISLYEMVFKPGEEIYLCPEESLVFPEVSIDDPSVVTYENGALRALKTGTTVIYDRFDCISYPVIVSDLYTTPRIDPEKELLPCARYTKEENDLLDTVLSYLIEEAGVKTRAGVVEAARFLTLRFPYKLEYFYENGRIDSPRMPEADGEGRYYHKGLYLHESRYENIGTEVTGEAVWGCPLYSYDEGTKTPNGFNCSGFISWVLLNGGYDPGDLGSGLATETDLTDLGERVPFKDLDFSALKPGDLLGYDGHIGILIGIDDGVYYIAQSYWVGDLSVLEADEETIRNGEWAYAVLMDSYYLNDGDLTMMWDKENS